MQQYSARDLGQVIRQHRRQRGLTQQQLATALNVSRPTVIALEAGTGVVALGTFLHAFAVLDIPLRAGRDVTLPPPPAASLPVGLDDTAVLDQVFGKSPLPRGKP